MRIHSTGYVFRVESIAGSLRCPTLVVTHDSVYTSARVTRWSFNLLSATELLSETTESPFGTTDNHFVRFEKFLDPKNTNRWTSTIYMLGAGLYSWFAEYKQDCLITENCQDRDLQIEESYDVWIYNLATKAIVEMVSPVQAVPTYARDNVNGFLSSILAWVRGQNGEAIGQREFEGFQIYQPDWLDGLSGMTDVCLTALTAVIKCDDWMERFEEPAYRGDLNNDTLTESICDPGCGASLKSYFGTVESSCAGYVLNEARPSKIGGTIWAGYNENCLQDTATG